jgi:hypothetical protein
MSPDQTTLPFALLGLDIDGVLTSSRSCLLKPARDRAHGSLNGDEAYALSRLRLRVGHDLPVISQAALDCVDPLAVGLVNHLTQATGARLLLTSSHRSGFAEGCGFGSPEHLARLSLYLAALGLRAPLHGVTPVLHRPRGEEVAAWLAAQDADAPRLALLDDSADYLAGQPLVRVDPEHGFSFSNFVAASRLLGVPQTGLIL